MSGSEKPKRYSAVRYWRYVFTPILLFIIVFGLYQLFTMSDTQSVSYDTLMKRTSASLLTPSSTFGSDIIRSMERLYLRSPTNTVNPSPP